MTGKAFSTLTAATTFVAGDGFVGRKSAETTDKTFSDSIISAWILASVITKPLQQSVHAAGTAYALTATSAKVDFGTTDPTITLSGTGTYLLRYRCTLDYNAATFSAVRTATMKLRRTNNTAADLTNSSSAVKTQIVTTITGSLMQISHEVEYTTSGAGDVIELWGVVDVVPTAGSLDVSIASIIAERIQQ